MNDSKKYSKIALAQVCATEDFDYNLKKAFAFIDVASQNNADLIAFPECFLYLGSENGYKRISESLDGSIVKQFQRKAKENNISILIGSIIEKISGSEQYFNTSVLIDKKGDICAIYRKIHLYDVNLPNLSIQESKSFKAGKKVVVCDHEIGTVGLSICYDLRFPMLYQKMAILGAKIIFIPAAFTLYTGKDHWLPLLQARAIENQVYIIAPAQFGNHGNNRFSYGNSVLIDPWGTVVSHCGEKEGVIFGEIDLDYLANVRENMPVSQHKVQGIDTL